MKGDKNLINNLTGNQVTGKHPDSITYSDISNDVEPILLPKSNPARCDKNTALEL